MFDFGLTLNLTAISGGRWGASYILLTGVKSLLLCDKFGSLAPFMVEQNDYDKILTVYLVLERLMMEPCLYDDLISYY